MPVRAGGARARTGGHTRAPPLLVPLHPRANGGSRGGMGAPRRCAVPVAAHRHALPRLTRRGDAQQGWDWEAPGPTLLPPAPPSPCSRPHAHPPVRRPAGTTPSASPAGPVRPPCSHPCARHHPRASPCARACTARAHAHPLRARTHPPGPRTPPQAHAHHPGPVHPTLPCPHAKCEQGEVGRVRAGAHVRKGEGSTRARGRGTCARGEARAHARGRRTRTRGEGASAIKPWRL